jgi:hypothetical protein
MFIEDLAELVVDALDSPALSVAEAASKSYADTLSQQTLSSASPISPSASAADRTPSRTPATSSSESVDSDWEERQVDSLSQRGLVSTSSEFSNQFLSCNRLIPSTCDQNS